MTAKAADDFDAIRQRLRELEAERASLRGDRGPNGEAICLHCGASVGAWHARGCALYGTAVEIAVG